MVVKIGYSFDSEVNSDGPLVRCAWFSMYIQLAKRGLADETRTHSQPSPSEK